MTIAENSSKKLVLKSGSTVLTLDKDTGKGVMTRKMMFVSLKPIEMALSDIASVAVDGGVDRASGIEVCNTMLVLKDGKGIAMPANDKQDAEAGADALRKFLGLKG